MRQVDELAETLVQARAAHRDQDWPRAYRLFTESRAASSLSCSDLGALCDAAWWLGRVDVFLEAGEAAFRGYVAADRPRDAAMTALQMAVSLVLRGDEAQGSGWLARAQRLLEDVPEGPEHGYVHYVLDVEGGLGGDDMGGVAAAAREVQGIGRRHDVADLVAVGTVGEGRALLRGGDVKGGLQLLDEAMLAVLHEHLDPGWAGNIYCHLMAACHELADVSRARQWTQATWDWLSEMPAAVLFTGICRVHRSQVHQVTGDWERAEQEAATVLDDLEGLHIASVAEAHYQLGELHRLRGDLDDAEQAYGRAREAGLDPQPGLALLCLARGRTEAAMAGIEAALYAAGAGPLARARLCAAQVDVSLAAGDLGTARRACAELEETAVAYGTSGLEAAALHCRGAVAVAEARPGEALPALRAACRRWLEVGAAHEAARAGVLLGESYAAIGDHGTARSELAAARQTFERLGAAPDLRSVEQVAARLDGDRRLPAGLTPREAEVLVLVAGGMTNRDVAEDLALSEKTVARHLSNIFTKLAVSTRTEAAAFAFQHGLVTDSRG